MAHRKAMARPVAADSLTMKQKENLHEVADLMLDIYQTLVDMRYIDSNALIAGPHSFKEDILAKYQECGLDPAIIYLYSILPYIDEIETDGMRFFQGGAFFNHMTSAQVEQGRDPRFTSPTGNFEAENGQYMYPWYTPLSQCSHRSPMIIYDAREHRIWIIDLVQPQSTDPVYCKGWYGEIDTAKDEQSDWGGSSDSNWTNDSCDDAKHEDTADEYLSSEGSSEFWDDEDDLARTQELDELAGERSEVVEYDEGFEHIEELSEWERQEAAAVKIQNSLEPVRSRPAGDVLRDIHQWYRELRELPGQHDHTYWPKQEVLRPLYLQHGWPTHFNADQFEVDLVLTHCDEKARSSAEEPLRKIECFAAWSEHIDCDIQQHEQSIAAAKTLDDEWCARFELWKTQAHSERNTRDLENARENADRMCPGGKCQRDQDLPLWRLEKAREETQWRLERVNRHNEQDMIDSYGHEPEQLRYMQARHRRAQQSLWLYQKALQAAKAEAELMCPGRTFQDATGIKSLGRPDTLTSIARQKGLLRSLEPYSKGLQEFATTVPHDAVQARVALEREIEKDKRDRESVQNGLARSEKSLAEHGNTDYIASHPARPVATTGSDEGRHLLILATT